MKDNTTSDEDNVHLNQNSVKRIDQQEGNIISPQSKDVLKASKRDERIQELKKQIEKGSYKVDPLEVAEKLYKYYKKK